MVARGAHHGLVAVGKVDERKTAMAQGDAAFGVDVLTFAVGPAMGHDVAHGFQGGQACIISLRKSADTAHGEASLQSYIKVRFIITNGADGGTPPAKSADFPTPGAGREGVRLGACYTAGKESLVRKGRLRLSADGPRAGKGLPGPMELAVRKSLSRLLEQVAFCLARRSEADCSQRRP